MPGRRARSPGDESIEQQTTTVKREASHSRDRYHGKPQNGSVKVETTHSDTDSPKLQATKMKLSRSASSASIKSYANSDSSNDRKDLDVNLTETSLKADTASPAKTSRPMSKKSAAGAAMMFDDLADATDEATTSFTVIHSCTYSNKFLGYTEHAMECDCSEEWDSATRQNQACGDDSDCINRATKMECVGDCGCGSDCQNQRFQHQQYAQVSVIKTEKKGFGLRADADLKANDFIFEYIGEVINEPQFRRRMLQYDEEGIKHFYFMSLSKGEFVDATKRGNLGRFCNHSCNPNCYVDKWVVGDKLRMGIFAERKIKAGEELVFNYNVDRYGANPQPCYCGEPNCTGFIGGKTQTESGTKLASATIEALGIDDADGWDTAVAKKPKKKKTGEDDEDYVERLEQKSLTVDGVKKVMAALMQCKEKWIAVKLLQRIQKCGDENVRNTVVKMHGYQILNSQLSAWKGDENIVLQILDILDKFPRLTRNKIVDSKIDTTLQSFMESLDERVAGQSARLVEEWSRLELAYRIPRKKREVTESTSTPAKAEPSKYDRRDAKEERKRSRSRDRTPPRGPSAPAIPSGPRSSLPQRSSNYFPPSRPPPRLNQHPLPKGWFQASDNGRTYFYSATGKTTWTRPTQPAEQPPPPPKQPSSQDVLKSIIDNIVSSKEKEKETKSTPDTPQTAQSEKKEDKWRSYSKEKQMKLYENTLFPHISHVMNKYKSKLPRDDLKRYAKDVAKKLVASDFKGGRVQDPSKISEKQEKKVKKYCKDFFDKCVYKHQKFEKEKGGHANGRQDRLSADASAIPSPVQSPRSPAFDVDAHDEDVGMVYNDDLSQVRSPNGDSAVLDLKRKRADETHVGAGDRDPSQSPMKRLKSQSPPPPPPPPAPPSDATPQTPIDNKMDIEIHADTNFKEKSMADVLAQAQADDGDSPYKDDMTYIKAEMHDYNMGELAKDQKENFGRYHQEWVDDDGDFQAAFRSRRRIDSRSNIGGSAEAERIFETPEQQVFEDQGYNHDRWVAGYNNPQSRVNSTRPTKDEFSQDYGKESGLRRRSSCSWQEPVRYFQRSNAAEDHKQPTFTDGYRHDQRDSRAEHHKQQILDMLSRSTTISARSCHEIVEARSISVQGSASKQAAGKPIIGHISQLLRQSTPSEDRLEDNSGFKIRGSSHTNSHNSTPTPMWPSFTRRSHSVSTEATEDSQGFKIKGEAIPVKFKGQAGLKIKGEAGISVKGQGGLSIKGKAAQ